MLNVWIVYGADSLQSSVANMSFKFTCPHCFHKTMVEDRFAGKKGNCVNCGKSITLPGGSEEPAEPTSTPTASKTPVAAATMAFPWKRYAMFGAILLCIACVSSIVVWTMAPTLVQLKARRDVTVCKQNLQRIARALNQYAEKHGSYPPSVTYDSTGKIPMHSWRVLILPELGYESLYNHYRMDLPWNAPENAQFLARCPSVFISPAADVATPGKDSSSYWLITGPGTCFPPTGPLAPKDITDGLENTLLVVETKNDDHPWTEPIDVDVTKLRTQIGKQPGVMAAPNSIGGTHVGGATAGFADGSSGWLPADTSLPIVKGLLSPNGNESIDGTQFQQ
ncbi:MAG: DUF1559 domain-containing protein [Pirellulales bacterium]